MSHKDQQDKIIARALRILEERAKYNEQTLGTPTDVKNYLRLKLGEVEHEVFCCVWLDSQHKVIDFEELFRGTINQTSVYPREIIKAALRHNAAAVIFAHNHPSGILEPSSADIQLTSTLKKTLDMVDVRTLDHFIIAASGILSFAERGLI